MKKIALILIILFGGIIRFWSLGDNGIGFFRDEAAFGFNPWAMLTTGADEYGQSFPVVFRSFEVFLLPAYMYLTSLVMAFLGINEFSTRFISTFSGFLLIPLTFLISRKVFNSFQVGVISSVLVAAVPWAIFYSRGTFEGNLALLFLTTAVYLWLKFLDKNTVQFFFLSLTLFILSMYSYHASRLIAPVFVVVSILMTPNWIKKWRLWLVGGIFALVLYLPLVLLSTSAAGSHRALGVSIFSSQMPVPGLNSRLGDWQKSYLYPKELLSLYLQYFSPTNLFWQGDYNKQRIVSGFSVFYFWLLPFYLIGLVFLVKEYKKYKSLLIWFLIAPLPAALTRDPFHTYRSILFYLPATLIIAYGLNMALKWLKRNGFALILFGLVLTFSLLSYLYSSFFITPLIYSRDWDYGYKQIAEEVKKQQDTLRVVIDDPMTESYIFFLFYGLIPADQYQNEAKKRVKNSEVYYKDSNELRPSKVGRFEFRHVDWPTERGDFNTLFIFPATRLYPSEFAGDPKLKLIKTIYSPLGDPAFYMIRVI